MSPLKGFKTQILFMFTVIKCFIIKYILLTFINSHGKMPFSLVMYFFSLRCV